MRPKSSIKIISSAALAILVVAFPLISGSNYQIAVVTNSFFFIVLAMSLNIVYGFAGLLSFAQVGFWGVGGYVGALTVTRLGGSVWEGMLLAAVAGAVIAAFIGAISLRLSNHAFVIVSIAFTLLLQMVAQEWISVTNGPMGIPGLRAPVIALGPLVLPIDTPVSKYFLALGFAVVCLGVMWLVLTSRIGRTLKMIKHDETLSRSFGVRTTQSKILAASFSAAFAGMAGALYVFYVSIVDPLIFDVYYTQLMLVIVIVGGLGSFWPLIGAGFLLTALPEILRTPNEIRMIYYGIILMASVMFFPGGFAGLLRRTPPMQGGEAK